ncbi:hypothetical protein LMG919_11260 [Xanthomonas vesicatoria]|nr:hypothetical protein LMG919_11260 [Xanthomonas vesicatoria]
MDGALRIGVHERHMRSFELQYRPPGRCMVLLFAALVVIVFTRMAVMLIQKKSRRSLTGGF